MYFFGPKYKSAIWDGTPPHLQIKSSLYVWRRAYGSQIFKRNSIILIRSRFIAFLKISASSAPGGWGRWVGDI